MTINPIIAGIIAALCYYLGILMDRLLFKPREVSRELEAMGQISYGSKYFFDEKGNVLGCIYFFNEEAYNDFVNMDKLEKSGIPFKIPMGDMHDEILNNIKETLQKQYGDQFDIEMISEEEYEEMMSKSGTTDTDTDKESDSDGE